MVAIDNWNWEEAVVIAAHPTEENFVSRYMVDMYPETDEATRKLKLAEAYKIICNKAEYTPPVEKKKGSSPGASGTEQ